MCTAKPSNGTRRNGFTLVELLVVVAMITVLLAIAIPAMKAVSSNRHVGEASRVLSATIQQVQALAADTGLPHGIWIERATVEALNPAMPDLDDTRANYAIQIYFAETPPPYAGDILGAKATIYDPGINPPLPNTGYASIPDSQAALIQFYVRAGDRIRFNYSGAYYTISNVTKNGSNFELTFVSAGPTLPIVGAALEFQIIRQPLRSSLDPVQLPKRSAIDLDSSGFGPFGTEFQPYVLPSNVGTIHDPTLNQTAGSLHLDPVTDLTQVRNDDDSPIVIMFNPSGSVERVYRGVPSGGTFNLVGQSIIDNIYLLIGQDDEQKHGNNLYNEDNVWITIGHLTGAVSSSPNMRANARADKADPSQLVPPTALDPSGPPPRDPKWDRWGEMEYGRHSCAGRCGRCKAENSNVSLECSSRRPFGRRRLT